MYLESMLKQSTAARRSKSRANAQCVLHSEREDIAASSPTASNWDVGRKVGGGGRVGDGKG
jgi:hypothetical protein